MTDPQAKLLALLLSFCSLVSTGLATWALTSVTMLREKAVQFEENIGDVDFGALVTKIEQIASDDERDRSQDEKISEIKATLGKFWQIHNATRSHINENRSEDEPFYRWPILESGQ